MSQTGIIGIVGGGQLGRMLTEAALPLGFKVIVVDPGENCPAAKVGAKQIIAAWDDRDALHQLAEQADFITFETEHFDITQLSHSPPGTGVSHPQINPLLSTIGIIQDKYTQKLFLQKSDVPVADFIKIGDEDSAQQALQDFGGRMLLKSRRGAYDGRGNAVVSTPEEVADAIKKLGSELYAEKFIPFKKELAVMIARDINGNTTAYPVTETVHKRNICVETLTPAGVSKQVEKYALQFANSVARHLEGAGVFGIEMFLTDDGKILVNEIAPRVHNSGHYTIEACETSQFEQHIRAITGMELGSTNMKVRAAAMVNILGERNGLTEVKGVDEAKAIPETYVHLYDKSPTKIDRKMGHITATGKTTEQALDKATRARKLINV